MKINKLNRLFLLAGLSVCLTNVANAQGNETLLLRSPSVSSNNLAFVYGGDIWIADLNGSNPRRLTVNPAVEQAPVFSPNGKMIAFTGNYDGNNDIYVIPIEGGAPKRVTYHPSGDLVRGWLNNDELYLPPFVTIITL